MRLNEGCDFVKNSRRIKILELISSHEIDTQDELTALLQENGFQVTQATVSRDIRELRLVKVLSDSGKYKYSSADAPKNGAISARLQTIFRESVLSYERAQNLVVIKTMPALASAACSAIDSMQFEGLVGTLAGDDTGMIILKDNAAAEKLIEVITKFLN